ncbi:Eco57I restriction-modification methylase domain-containing protein [Ruminococcus sp.]
MTENGLSREADIKMLPQLIPCAFSVLAAENDIIKAANDVKGLFSDIPAEMWKDNVQLIGQLYQYYNSEKKRSILGGLRNNTKVETENMAAATQIFTPDWIVRYMTENTLGRLFVSCCGYDTSEMEYCIPRDTDSKQASPEEITLLDPCAGSGNILVYAFDMFMKLYSSRGTASSDAVRLILSENLFGLDIDSKVCRIARFALIMKAARYYENAVYDNIVPQIYDMEEMRGGGFEGSELFGSLMRPDTAPKKQNSREAAVYRLLSRKYSAVVTNPPYMSSSSMNSELLDFLKRQYPDYHADLFSAFMVRCSELAENGGYLGFLTPCVWMFIRSYEKLR